MGEIAIARRLARDMKHVYVFFPTEESFPTVNKAIIGDGFPDIERAESIWDVKDECDLFVFPDIYYVGEQTELEEQGKAVWGSRNADRYE